MYDIGAEISAGAPNIYGRLLARKAPEDTIAVSGDGTLFTDTDTTDTSSYVVALDNTYRGTLRIVYDAEKYDSIYGNSSSIQPQAVAVSNIIKA